MIVKITFAHLEELLGTDTGSMTDVGAWFAAENIEPEAVMELSDRLMQAMHAGLMELAERGAVAADMTPMLHGLIGTAFEVGWEAHKRTVNGTWQPQI